MTMKALLGIQSHYSFHWGTASPARWFARAHDLGYEYLGFADIASLHGLPEMLSLAATWQITLLCGAAFFHGGGTAFLFVDAPLGYGNLCQRISEWHERCDPQPDAMAGGLPMPEPGVAFRLLSEQRLLSGLVFIVDDENLWHRLDAAGAEVYWRVGPTLAAPPAGIDRRRAVFAPGPLMLHADEYITHRLLRAVGGADSLSRMPRDGRGGPCRMARPGDVLRTREEYAAAFAPYGEAMERADALAERLGRFHPCREVLHPPEPTEGPVPESGETALVRLRRLAYEGAAIRYGKVDAAVRERLEKELMLIARKGFAEYFLVVHDIVARLAGGDGKVRKGRSITCGRGSGAASLVNYCLGVTNVDVLKHNLLFERFLNEGRKDPPDIDVDFAWDERDDLLDRVLNRYGKGRVGRVANHNRYDRRGAFRAAARAVGFSDGEISRHLREKPDPRPAMAETADPPPAAAAMAKTVRLKNRLHTVGRADRADWREAANLAQRLIGMPHGLSMHCGGVVISPGDLCRCVPVVSSRKGQPTIQWEKDGAEEMGLVKFDLLGNRSLAVIRDAVRAVARDRNMAEDAVIAEDPTEDEATQDLVRRGDTFGVFYLESPSMRLLMAKAGRGDFEHAVIHSSIIRPAANAFINEYLERVRTGKKTPFAPQLEGIFDESYGIPVYQEDVVKLAIALCGYDYAQADAIRKCLGKRNARERLQENWAGMKKAARRRGVEEPVIKEFWRILMSMTGYSFCKPHSASYAQVSYEAAYLRAHYPAWFIAAVLSNGGGYYSTQAYVSEAMRMGLLVLPPDVNASDGKWHAEGENAVRTGLMAISGLGVKAIGAIAEERARGPFVDVDDFVRRVRIDADDMRRLVLVGALDSLAPEWNRPQILWRSVREGHEAPVEKGVASLFSAPHPASARQLPPPPLEPYTLRQKLDAEYDALGFLPGAHPMALFADDIRAGAALLRGITNPLPIKAADLSRHVGRLVTVLAWPISAKIVETKDGDAMVFQSFEDEHTLFETVVFPREYRRYHPLLDTVQPLWVTGRVLEEFGVASLQILGVVTASRLAREARQGRGASRASLGLPGRSGRSLHGCDAAGRKMDSRQPLLETTKPGCQGK